MIISGKLYAVGVLKKGVGCRHCDLFERPECDEGPCIVAANQKGVNELRTFLKEIKETKK